MTDMQQLPTLLGKVLDRPDLYISVAKDGQGNITFIGKSLSHARTGQTGDSRALLQSEISICNPYGKTSLFVLDNVLLTSDDLEGVPELEALS